MLAFFFVSPQVNLALGLICLAIALAGRFLLGSGEASASYLVSINGLVSVAFIFTVIPAFLYRRFASDYESASPLKVSQIDKSVLLLAVFGAAIIVLFLTASEYVRFASLGYLGLCVVGFVRLIALVRRKENF